MALTVLRALLLLAPLAAAAAEPAPAWTDLLEEGVATARAGAPAQAEELFRRALERLEGGAPDDPRAATLVNNLGVVLERQGELEEASVRFAEALGRRRAIFGKESAPVAETLNNLGELARRQGRLEEALKLQDEALRIRQAVLGADHPAAAESHNNRGVVLGELGRNDEALAAFEEALEIRRRRLGELHAASLQTLVSSALTAAAGGDPAIAEAELREAWSRLGEAGLSGRAPALPVVLALARVLIEDARPSAAAAALEKAIAVGRRGGLAPLALAALEQTLARALVETGDAATAQARLEASLERQREAFGRNDARLIATLTPLAEILIERRRLGEASRILDWLLELQEESLAADDPRLVATLNERAFIAFEEGRLTDAAATLERALRIEEAAQGDDAPALVPTLENLAVVLFALDRQEEAEAVRNRIRALRTAAEGG